MASPELLGIDGTSDLSGELTTSLSDSAKLSPALDGNSGFTRLLPTPRDSAATDPLSQLSTWNAASASNPVDNAINDSLLFDQPLTLVPTFSPSLNGDSTAFHSTAETDWLTGSTSNTPLISPTSGDPLTSPATAGAAFNEPEEPLPDLEVTAATTPAASPTWGETIAVT